MSVRRPRIKAAAILPPKRPARESIGAAIAPKHPKTEVKSEATSNTDIESSKPPATSEEKVPPNTLEPSVEAAVTSDNKPVDKHAAVTKLPVEEVVPVVPEHIDLNDNDVFKSPPVVANQKRTEIFSASDFDSERTDELAAKGIYGPPSPVKVRQRIRPTPFFGMRRNSTQGYGSDMEDEPRRQRHTSTSSNTGSTTPHRMRPPNFQRIRTESSCSNISEYSRDQNTKVTRKFTSSEDHSRAHAARKDFLSRFNGKTPEKSNMKMSDLIYYNPTTNLMVASEPPKELSEVKLDAEINAKESVEKDAEKGENETSMPVPQLKLGPDGEMILDEQSLVIETTAGKEARVTLANTKVIYMDEFSGNSGFYRRSKRTKDWTSEETIKFYRCLHTVGTDFSLMLTLFPNRSRKDLKLKFKKEEKTNLNLINKALLFPKTFNVAELKQELEKEQQELETKKKELEEISNKIIDKKIKIKSKERKLYKSRSSNLFKDGDTIYEQEAVARNKEETNESAERVITGSDDAAGEQMEATNTTVEVPKEEIIDIKVEKKSKRPRKQKFKKDTSSRNDATPILVVVPPDKMIVHSEVGSNKTTDRIELPRADTIIPMCFKNENSPKHQTNENYTVIYETHSNQIDDGTEILYEITEVPLTPSTLKNYTIIQCSDINTDKYFLSNHNPTEKNDSINKNHMPISKLECIDNTSNPCIQSSSPEVPKPKVESFNAETDVPDIVHNSEKQNQDVQNEIADPNSTIEYVEIVHSQAECYDDLTELEAAATIAKTENTIKDYSTKDEYDEKATINGSCIEIIDSSCLKQTKNKVNIKEESNRSKVELYLQIFNDAKNKAKQSNQKENKLDAIKTEKSEDNHTNEKDTKFRKLKPKPCITNKNRSKTILKDTSVASDHETMPVTTKEQLKVQEVLENNEEINKSADSITTKTEMAISDSPLNAVDILMKCYNELDQAASEINAKIENAEEDYMDDEADIDAFYNDDSSDSSCIKDQKNEDSNVKSGVVTQNRHEEAEIKVPFKTTENDVENKDPDEYADDNNKVTDEQENHDNDTGKTEESLKDIDDEMERFMNNDLGTILANLINGSLVVVASEDENNPDKLVNEIYVMNKETGTLSDMPLDLPEDVVNCIVEELNVT